MVYINECIDVNTALKKFLQIYELFAYDQSVSCIVSKTFPTQASPRLYLDIFFQIYGASDDRKKFYFISFLADDEDFERFRDLAPCQYRQIHDFRMLEQKNVKPLEHF